jgi:hypothetical protein
MIHNLSLYIVCIAYLRIKSVETTHAFLLAERMNLDIFADHLTKFVRNNLQYRAVNLEGV